MTLHVCVEPTGGHWVSSKFSTEFFEAGSFFESEASVFSARLEIRSPTDPLVSDPSSWGYKCAQCTCLVT